MGIQQKGTTIVKIQRLLKNFDNTLCDFKQMIYIRSPPAFIFYSVNIFIFSEIFCTACMKRMNIICALTFFFFAEFT